MAGKSGGPRVLVVDDADDMRILIHRALSSGGYAVDVASTLTEARAMDPGQYDALLVDAHLGRERGVELIEALLAEDPAAATRCLVITGGTADGLPDGVAYLAKPFQPGDLIDAVRALHQPDTLPAHARPAGIVPDSGVHHAASVPPGRKRVAPAESPSWQLLGLTRRLRARERHELVDFLHDGPIQDLAAVILELQMLSRSASSGPAPRFGGLLERLDSAAGSLRWLVDGDWPFTGPETRLADALQRMTWLLAAPATVDPEPGPLTAVDVPVIVDIVELMLLELMPAGSPARAHVAARNQQGLIRIELTLTPAAGNHQVAGDPAAAEASLDGLACALGATAHADFREELWRATLDLRKDAASRLARSGPAGG